MCDYAVSTAFLGKDGGITKLFEALGRDADGWADKGSKAFERVGQGADRAAGSFDRAANKGNRFGHILKGVLGADLAMRGLEKIKEGVGGVISDFIHFDHDMANAMVRFEDVGPKAANFKGQLGEAERAVRKLGITSKFSFDELAKGYEQVGRSKLFDSKEGIAALVPLMHLNIDAQGDFGASTKDVLGTMGAWAMNTGTAAEKLKTLTDLTDLFAQGQSEALMTVSEMAESMHTIGPVARMMGADIKDVTAMTLLLAKAGITGEKAGMSLKNIFLHFTDAKSRGIMKELGVDLVDKKTGQFRRMTNILGDLDKVLKRRFNPADRTTLFAAMAGMRGVVGGADLVRQLGEFEKIRASLDDVHGRGGEIAAVMQETPQSKLERLRNKITEKGFEVIDKYGARFESWIDRTAAAVDKFDMGPINQTLSSTGTILKGISDVMSPFAGVLPGLVASWVLWNGALTLFGKLGLTEVFAALAAGPLALAASLGTVTIALGALAKANLPLVGFWLAMEGLYTLSTGKDNAASEFLQRFGLHKLKHDEDGNILPNDYDGYAGDGKAHPAPNKGTGNAQTHHVVFHNAPAGTTFNGNPVGAGPSLDKHMLGWN